MSQKYINSLEWIKQAHYDLETAEAMFEARKYIYTIFMCHLSVEKMLKGLYADKSGKNPPKTHDLTYLLEKIELKLSKDHQVFLEDLNDLSVPTRYPDDIEILLKHYRKNRVKNVLDQTKELIQWLKEKS